MKRQRSSIDDSVYPLFANTTIIDFIIVFENPDLASRALELLEERRRVHGMTIFAYVLMPSHFHAIIQAPTKGESSRFLASWKSLTARFIVESVPPRELQTFAEAARRYHEPVRKAHKVWMARFDDVALYDQNTFATKVEYIHYNPVRAGIAEHPENYPYSSAGFYLIDRLDAFVKLTDCRTLLLGRTPKKGLIRSAQGLTPTRNEGGGA